MWEKVLIGANVSLSVMSDDFVDQILGSLQATNQSNLWLETDDVSSIMRGKPVHVFDLVQAMALHAAKSGKHANLQAAFIYSEVGNDPKNPYREKGNLPANMAIREEADQYAAAKFSLYPLGQEDYIDLILEQIEEMKKYVDVTILPFATKLEGNITNIFKGLEAVFGHALASKSSHFVMQVSLSINSPSHQLGGEK